VYLLEGGGYLMGLVCFGVLLTGEGGRISAIIEAYLKSRGSGSGTYSGTGSGSL
jgi:hypothetical protein